MSRQVWFRSFLIVASVLLCALYASADSRARIVRLSYVDGKVQLDRGDGRGLQSAFLNMPVSEGTSIVTGDDSKAEVQFEDGSNIRLVPDSEIDFPQLGLRSNGAKFTTVELKDGGAYFNFHKHDKDEFLLHVANRQVQLQHSSSFRVELDHGAMKLAVLNGEVKVSGDGVETLAVKKNETFSLDPSDDRYFLAKEISSEPWDQWNTERDEYGQAYASSNLYSSYSPYSYGISDLNYYGSYYNSPWGVVWRPYYTNALWDPFADGAWVRCRGFGWTWVSAYPWGWLPYHYGSWIFWPGLGWVWQPGQWNAWAPVVPVVNPPGNFHPPTPPPQHGGGVGVVTVGHGPGIGPHPIGPGGRPAVVGDTGGNFGVVGIGPATTNGSNWGPGVRPGQTSGSTAPRNMPGGMRIEPPTRSGASHNEPPHFSPPPRALPPMRAPSFSAPAPRSSPPVHTNSSRPH
jgi:hypothetical protein